MAVVESLPSMEDNLRLPVELEQYLREAIYHMVGFCSTEEKMQQKSAEVKEEHKQLQAHISELQQKMRELEFKCGKSKEEAALNAQALRRQVAECQKLREHCSRLRQECTRLENECQLYQNDREVFMEAADEAEERAAEADERASEADARVNAVLAEIERLKRQVAQGNPKGELGTDSSAGPRLELKQLEAENARLQKELNTLKAETQLELGSAQEQIAKLGKERVELVALVSSANERYREFLRELRAAHDGSTVLKEVGLGVNGIVTLAATSGVCKAMEQENRAAASDCKSLLRSMKKELLRSKGRLSAAEEKIQALLHDLEEVKEEAAISKERFSTAQADIQRLKDENRVLKLILSARTEAPSKPNGNLRRCMGGERLTVSSLGWHRCMQRF